MNVPCHDALLTALLPAALAAGRLQLDYLSQGVSVVRKADNSPVTIADQESEALLLDVLERVAPTVPVVAEEQVAAGNIPEVADTFFLVDALDGTRDFINGRGGFTINVALVRDHLPVFGLILQPVSGEVYVTRADGSAARAQLDLAMTSLAPSEIVYSRIETREPDLNDLTVALSSSHRSQRLETACRV